jgi:CHAT domain-containing protein
MKYGVLGLLFLALATPGVAKEYQIDPVGSIFRALTGQRGPSTRLTGRDYDSVVSNLQRAERLFNEGDLFKAIDLTTQLIQFVQTRAGRDDSMLQPLYELRGKSRGSLAVLGRQYLISAQQDFEESLRLIEMHYKQPGLVGFAHEIVAVTAAQLDRWEFAKTHFEAALANYPKNTPPVARLHTFVWYAQFACLNDDLFRCKQLLDAARAQALSMRGAVHPDDQLEVDSAEAMYFALTGQLSPALSTGDRVLKAIEKTRDGVDLRKQVLLQRHAFVLEKLGAFDEAKRTYRLLLQGVEPVERNPTQAPPDSQAMVPSALATVAKGYVRMNQTAEGATIAQRALAFLRRTSLPLERWQIADLYLVVAADAEEHSRLDEAQSVMTEALRIYGACAYNYAHLAAIEGARKQRLQAEAALEKGFAILASSAGCEDDEWSFFAYAARYFSNENMPAVAIALGKEAVARTEAARARLQDLDAEHRAQFVADRALSYYELAGWLSDQGREDEAAYVLDLLKDQELQDFTRGANLSSSRAGGTLTRENERRGLDSTRTGAGPKVQTLINEVGGGNESPKPVASAPADSGGHRITPGNLELTAWYDRTRVILQLRDSSGLVVRKQMPIAEATLSSMIVGFSDSLRTVVPLDRTKNSPLWFSQNLYALLWAPVAADIDRLVRPDTTVQLVLNGRLRQVPFSALHDGKQFLVERYTLLERSDAGALAARAGRSRNLAVFSANKPPQGLPELHHADEEADLIANLAASAKFDHRAFSEKRFSRSAFLDALTGNGYSRVHVASHFKLPVGSSRSAFLALGDGTLMPTADFQTISLSGLDLMVLSACDSARPSASIGSQGGELESLATVLRRRGAASVVAALWSVDDEAAPLVMREFYRTLLSDSRGNAAAALRAAQHAMLNGKDEAKRHPYYWAPFLALGELPERSER